MSVPQRIMVLRLGVDAITLPDAAERIAGWAAAGESRGVFVAAVHLCTEMSDDPSLQAAAQHMDLVVADGRPVFWAQRWLGSQAGGQVRGMDLTRAVYTSAALRGLPVGFYGSTSTVLTDLVSAVRREQPALKVDFAEASIFRPLSAEEDDALVERIKASGVRILFVGLGCPRQERFVSEHLGRLPVVMLGVGAAFDFISGHKSVAPRWVQQLGLEWLFRLLAEPRRLWRRYLILNPRFLWNLLLQRLGLPF